MNLLKSRTEMELHTQGEHQQPNTLHDFRLCLPLKLYGVSNVLPKIDIPKVDTEWGVHFVGPLFGEWFPTDIQKHNMSLLLLCS